MKQIVLCADDYGQNAAISQAILALVKKKRLSAVSCLASSPIWLHQARKLNEVATEIDIGLHFNLTDAPLLTPLSPCGIKKLLARLIFKKIDLTAIAAELQAQIDQFIAGTGRLPDFIDGHQHVHQLPGVRDVFLRVYRSRFPQATVYIRSLANMHFAKSAHLKQWIIRCFGARQFQSQLIFYDIPHNTTFAGMYNFACSKRYADFFNLFLKQIKSNGIIMCHPGEISQTKDDPIAAARFAEFEFFMSDQFTELCKLHQISISRFSKAKGLSGIL